MWTCSLFKNIYIYILLSIMNALLGTSVDILGSPILPLPNYSLPTSSLTHGQYACVLSLSHVWLFATPWTVARQAPLSTGFPRQEYWSGLPCPPPGDLPDPGIEPASPAAAGGFFTRAACGNPTASVHSANTFLPRTFISYPWKHVELNTCSCLCGPPWRLSWERICLQCRRPGFKAWVGKIPWRRERLPTAAFWPGDVHGVAKSQTRLSDFHFHVFVGLVFPPQCSLSRALAMPVTINLPEYLTIPLLLGIQVASQGLLLWQWYCNKHPWTCLLDTCATISLKNQWKAELTELAGRI